MKSNTTDVLELETVVNDGHTRARRVNDHVTSQGAKNQELDRRLEDHTDQITTLELGMENRTDDLQTCQLETTNLREVTNDLQA